MAKFTIFTKGKEIGADSIIMNWSQIAKIGNNKLVKSSYFWIVFVPIAAKIMTKVPREIVFCFTQSPITLTLSLPFSWKMFFFASLAFGLATLFYSLSCPLLIKRYETYSDFEIDGSSSEQLIKYFSDWLRNAGEIHEVSGGKRDHKEAVNEVKKKYGGYYIDGKKILEAQEKTFLSHMPPWQLSNAIIINPNKDKDAFWYIKRLMNYDKPIIRIIISALYAVGFILIGLLLIKNVVYVIDLIANN